MLTSQDPQPANALTVHLLSTYKLVHQTADIPQEDTHINPSDISIKFSVKRALSAAPEHQDESKKPKVINNGFDNNNYYKNDSESSNGKVSNNEGHGNHEPKRVKLFNNGFDNELNDYIVREGETINHYIIEEVIGHGSFGQVCRCRDSSTQEVVAIKIIKNKLVFTHQAQIEIKLLQSINSHKDEHSKLIVKCIESFTHRNHTWYFLNLIQVYLNVTPVSFSKFAPSTSSKF